MHEDHEPGLPWSALLALASAGFVTILTEALPAGLLTQVSEGMGVSEAWAGQLVTVYALGSLLAAIPVTLATQGMRRRPLLLWAIAGFGLANGVTAWAKHPIWTLAARGVGGVSAGLLWALIAGHAARMVPARLQGRAISIAMAGTPLALSLGIPLGTFMGQVLGWRTCFWMMTALTLVLLVWVRMAVPDFAGQVVRRRGALSEVLRLPGVRPVLAATLAFVLAHNILYTYIVPILRAAGQAEQTGVALGVFGVLSLVGIAVVGVWVDRWLRPLTLASTALFGVSACLLWAGSESAWVVYGAVGLWGLAFGGAATLFQTALVRAAGAQADVAQSMLVTAWNLAIGGGGLLGGLLLTTGDVRHLSMVALALLASTWWVVWGTRARGFGLSTQAGG